MLVITLMQHIIVSAMLYYFWVQYILLTWCSELVFVEDIFRTPLMSRVEDGSRDPLVASAEDSHSTSFALGCMYDAAQDVSIHGTEIILLCIVKRRVTKNCS